MFSEGGVNSINKYSKSLNNVAIGTKLRRRLLFGLLLILLAAVVVLSISLLRVSAYRNMAEEQFSGRTKDAVENALVELSGMTGTVQSNSSSKLARIRQYIFSIDQINQISMRIRGEAGRIVPQQAITALYDDIDTYERLVQTATSSTLDIRTLLQTHLMALNEELKK